VLVDKERMFLLLLLSNAFSLQPLSGNVISRVQSLQPTLQLGLWAAVDNM